MHHALIRSVIFSVVLLLAILSGSTGDPGPQQTNSLTDEGLFLQNSEHPHYALAPEGIEEDKREWKTLQSGWGKRTWNGLQSNTWGKRDWNTLQNSLWGKRGRSDRHPLWDKRGWQEFQVLWGKRDLRGSGRGKRIWDKFHRTWGKRDYSDDSYEELEDSDNYEDEDEDNLQEYKRAWKPFRGQWGKRNWSHFKGTWGKRDPACHNLKGLWGKRLSENWNKLHAIWGK